MVVRNVGSFSPRTLLVTAIVMLVFAGLLASASLFVHARDMADTMLWASAIAAVSGAVNLPIAVIGLRASQTPEQGEPT